MFLRVVPLQSVVQHLRTVHFQRMRYKNIGFVQAGNLKIERIAAFVLYVGIGIRSYILLYRILYRNVVTVDTAYTEFNVLVCRQRRGTRPVSGTVYHGNFRLPGIISRTCFHFVQTGGRTFHKSVLLAVECLVLNIERSLKTFRFEYRKSALRILITFQYKRSGTFLRCFNITVIGGVGAFACNHSQHQQPQP